MTDERSMGSTPTVAGDYAGEYYEGYAGPPYTYEEPHWQQFFGGIAGQLVALFAPATAYDAGCAKGFLVRALLEKGVDAYGGDISEHAISGAPPGLAERLEVKDLTTPFDGRYDLITCIEVLEHMAAADAQQAIAHLCAATDVIVLSTTPDDFAEPTHINIRQPAQWAVDFAAQGFFRRTDIDASFVAPWAVVYQRSAATAATVVAAYESLLSPLSLEVVAKRRALLEAQRDLDEARAPVKAAVTAALGERDAVARERDAVAAERDAIVADRAAVLAERDRLLAHIDSLGLADLQAERMSRLAMADELVGLRAELAQVKVVAENSVVEAGREAVRLREVLQATEQQLQLTGGDLAEARRVVAELRGSTTWRIGSAALTPVRVARLPRRGARALARRAKAMLRR